MDWIWVVFLFMILFGSGALAFVRDQLESRRRYQLEMKKQDLKIAEANAEASLATTKQLALEVRAAELEIERFDRRMGPTGLPVVPRLASGVDPDIVREITESATAVSEKSRDDSTDSSTKLTKQNKKE